MFQEPKEEQTLKKLKTNIFKNTVSAPSPKYMRD